MTINAAKMHYRELNQQLHGNMNSGVTSLTVENICGQRYIGLGVGSGISFNLKGVPGNDLGAFMNGASIFVSGNAQDGVGNTMNAGKIVIQGDAGDVLGHSMRGGKIFVGGSVGYRVGIHMKQYDDHYPVVVIGARAHDYLGEYMAGGMLVVLNRRVSGKALAQADSPVGNYVGTGMHGGVIYIRGRLEPHQLGQEAKQAQLEDEDWASLTQVLDEYARVIRADHILADRNEFTKLLPHSTRPYGRLYAY